MNSPRYALGIRPSSPAHLGGTDGRTLCGLFLSMFGPPLQPEAEHRPCRTCEGIQVARSRNGVPA